MSIRIKPMTSKLVIPQCRFGDGPAAARFRTPQGCVCFPDDREQDLCMQHIIKDGTLGDKVEMIEDYTLGKVLTPKRPSTSDPGC